MLLYRTIAKMWKPPPRLPKISCPGTLLHGATHLWGKTCSVRREHEALTRVCDCLLISTLWYSACVSHQVTPLLIFLPEENGANEASRPQMCTLGPLTSPNATAPAPYFLGDSST